ncbi:hypothetical protein L6452_05949 [Arctium lappa]|uniref:Uncharacterized protein n=1 Tax=Arctium lappa TaxID=4217 RepID=A0ACB9EIH8_ARCLA|nr:hypothetical protein L6452_05949 [Arctium lappa]
MYFYLENKVIKSRCIVLIAKVHRYFVIVKPLVPFPVPNQPGYHLVMSHAPVNSLGVMLHCGLQQVDHHFHVQRNLLPILLPFE